MPSSPPLDVRLSRIVPWAAAAVFLLWIPFVLPWDHSFDDADPEVLNGAYRLATGEPLYHSVVSPPWAVTPYTPLYLALTAAGLRITGLSYTPARIVSLVSSLAVAAGILALARKFRGGSAEGIHAACLLFLAPPVFYNVARPHPQMLGAALSLWSFVLLESPSWPLANLVSPLLAVLGVYTKQTQIVFVLSALGWLALRKRARLPLWLGVVALLGLGPVPFLQAWSHGQFLPSVVGMNALPFSAWLAPAVLIQHAGIFCLFLFEAFSRLARRLRDLSFGAIDVYLAVLTALTVPSLGRVGASGQWVTELLIVTVVYLLATGGVGFPGRRRLLSLQLGLILAYALVFILVQEGPWDWASLRAAPAVRSLLRTKDGPVISQQGSFSLFTRGEIHLQLFHFTGLAKMGRWDERPLLREVGEHRLAFVVTEFPLEGPLDSNNARERFTEELHDALRRNYRLQTRLGPYFVYVAAPAEAAGARGDEDQGSDASSEPSLTPSKRIVLR